MVTTYPVNPPVLTSPTNEDTFELMLANAANELTTVASTTTELDAESLLTFTGTVFTLGVGTSVVNSGTWSPGTVSTGKALVLGI